MWENQSGTSNPPQQPPVLPSNATSWQSLSVSCPKRSGELALRLCWAPTCRVEPRPASWPPLPSPRLGLTPALSATLRRSGSRSTGLRWHAGRGRALPRRPAARHLQGSGVPRRAAALPRDVVAGGSVLALASLVAVVAVGALLTAVLAAPAPEARGAVARPRDGVAQGPVFALASAAAVRSPVVAITG